MIRRDLPELTVLFAIAVLQIAPQQSHDGPNLLHALASVVDRVKAVRALATADFLDRPVKFPDHNARQLLCDSSSPFEFVCHVTSVGSTLAYQDG
jgi:hypothetical protein